MSVSDGIENPYESPQAEVSTVNPLSDRVITEDMLYYLKGAAPWLRFIGIVGFIGLGLTVVGLFVLAFGIRSVLPDSPEFAAVSIIGPVMVLIYIPFLVIYFFPVLFLFRFGKKLKSYQYTNDSQDLVDAFKNNKALWTFIGVLTIIGLSIIALVVVIAIFGALIG